MARVKKADSAKLKDNNLEEYPQEEAREEGGFSQYLRFGESYTSLILGIIVVIIATALLLSFVNNRDGADTPPISEQVQNIAISKQPLQLTPEKEAAVVNPTKAPQQVAKQEPTKAPTAKPTQVPTTAPTKVPAKPTNTPTKAAAKAATQSATKAPTAKPTEKPKAAPANEKDKKQQAGAKEWKVQKNETLWDIAEKHYSSGYNWVDIARANKLSNPNAIHAGNILVLPNVDKKTATIQKDEKRVATSDEHNNNSKIQGNSHKVQKGDTLWDISIRAYGDGFKWGEIAKANNLKNPNVIEVGQTLKLPRK